MDTILDRRSIADRRREARLPTPPAPEYSQTTRFFLGIKRTIDVIGSLALLIVVSPVFLILTILIPLDSPGPVLFHSPRRGYWGRIFNVFKFRTMQQDAHIHREELVNTQDPNRLLFKIKADPRITRLGKFLRQYSIDELPQLFNVLRGEMSLIGPRPLLKEDFEKASLPGPLYRQWVRDRHMLRPGLTGLWQVSGRTDLPLEQSMQLDLQYIEQWSPWMDVKIILRTPKAVLEGKGAY